MTSHDIPTQDRVINLAALSALAQQGHFKAVLMNADVTVTSSVSEEILLTCIVAWANSRLGNQEVAAELARSAYERAVVELGEDDPTTLVALNDYARFSHRAGRGDVGLKVGKEVVERRARVLGENHPKTLTSKANLFRYQYENELPVSVADLDALMVSWSEADPKRVDAAHLSAALLRADVMQSLAAAARAEVVGWYIATLGNEHPDTVRAVSSEL